MLDRDERRIMNAFSDITVNTKSLERKIKQRMQNNQYKTKPAPRRRLGLILAAAMLIAAMLGGTVYAAAQGAFDRFFSNYDSPFVELLQPVETYVTDQGFRIEAIAARRFDHNTLVYLSLQDITGQDRLTPYAEPVVYYPVVAGLILVNFDHATNTAYFQLEIRDDGSDTVELPIKTVIYCQSWGTIQHLPIPVDLTVLGEADMISYPMPMLVPNAAGLFPELPENDVLDYLWISNMAVMDGNLHVQIGRHGSGGLHRGINLFAPDGSIVFSGYGHNSIFADEYLQPYQPELPEDWGINVMFCIDAPYSFTEIVFPVDVDALGDYSLTITGGTIGGGIYSQSGDWTMTICTADANNQINIWEGSAQVGDVIIETVTVTPLGVRITGTYAQLDGIWLTVVGMDLYIVTPEGNTLLRTMEGRFIDFPASYDFEVFSRDRTGGQLIDVAAVSAIILDGVTIPIV